MQEDNDEHLKPVCYYSKKLNACQKNYTITEKEALALVLTVRAFRIYLSGGHTVVYTDHEPLKFIYANAGRNQRILRWSMELQTYDLEIKHIPGSQNIVADYLSRHVVNNDDLFCILHERGLPEKTKGSQLQTNQQLSVDTVERCANVIFETHSLSTPREWLTIPLTLA
jgi:hypothetical protein